MQAVNRQWLIDQLQMILDCEQKMKDVYPKVKKHTNNKLVLQYLDNATQQVEGEIKQLQQVFEQLEESPDIKPNEAFRSLLKAKKAAIDQSPNEAVKNQALLANLLYLKSYEVSYYNNAQRYARSIGLNQVADQLETLWEDEQKELEELNQLSREYLQKTFSGEIQQS